MAGEKKAKRPPWLRAYDKAAAGLPLTRIEHEALDVALYGRVLRGPGPWVETPLGRQRKWLRRL